ncbi:hypothetical protein FA95DRAFT_1564650 [Auriscalpium vulgare]|uniref:Uncharacterized protein n=1 Tax=Auriscalpium vulgare TaxID=40419 RepID=A0ACB8RES9_9AGAM|nr:hypothetical protein FA95DRAFT_1564650 [Auriscalpium vulgare]
MGRPPWNPSHSRPNIFHFHPRRKPRYSACMCSHHTAIPGSALPRSAARLRDPARTPVSTIPDRRRRPSPAAAAPITASHHISVASPQSYCQYRGGRRPRLAPCARHAQPDRIAECRCSPGQAAPAAAPPPDRSPARPPLAELRHAYVPVATRK